MKTSYAIKVVTILFVTLNILPLAHAQDSFDSKRKKATSVNTTSLRALKKVLPSGSSTGKSVSSTHDLPKAFHKPLIQAKQKVFYSRQTGLPVFINTDRTNDMGRLGLTTNIPDACTDYLKELKGVLQITRSDVGFSIREVRMDATSKIRIRLNQHYKNIPVYGAEAVVHLNRNGHGKSFNGKYFNIQDNIEINPAISPQVAERKVNSQITGKSGLHVLSDTERKFVQYERPHTTLCIYQEKSLLKSFVLAYHIISTPSLHQRWEFFVDANTGNVLHKFETICSVDGPRTANAADLNDVAQDLNTYQKGASYFLIDTSRPMYNLSSSVLPDGPIGAIWTIDLSNTFGDNMSATQLTSADNLWNTTNSKKAVSAHYNAGIAYNYFLTKHGRNSIDGAGGTVTSVINVADQDGQPLDNAFWNGKFIWYGNGDVQFKPLAGSLDVAGHEMTHGVIENTANLEYQGESGAINESLSDIFGSMMDPSDWLIGEDIVKPEFNPSGALRSLSDPHNGGTELNDPGYQPMHTNEMFTGTQDNGGVHINSGIPNNAFYRYAEAITREKAAAVFYKALDDYLTKSSQFIDLRLAVVNAAGDLYGPASNEVTQAGLAFDAVGIGAGTGGDYTENLPGNSGVEFLLIYNTDLADDNTLYRTNLSGSKFEALSQTRFVSRPSITDDGTTAVFVGEDNKIHALNSEPGKVPGEIILQNDPIWSNAVVSKGGTKLAAVTLAQDATIYVYDFASEEWAEFTLYNPTYTEGVNSAGPVYADALEWDYDGEFLVYDCFNRLENSDGTDIEYWDVNFIQVWDNEKKDFSDGIIQKLFPSLPDGVSIGNPAFAKVSPYIIAFDYFDEAASEYAVLGCNIETNEVNVIAANNSLGWPSYNNADSRIAFTSMEDETTYNTNYITLNSDKISSGVAATGLFTDAKWPVYFSTGEREIGDQIITGILEQARENISLNCYPTIFTDEVSIALDQKVISGSRIELFNTMAQSVYDFSTRSSDEKSITLNLENIKTGYYVLRISNVEKTGTCRIFKP
jgi:Zn-dependent metalloprotease